MIFLVLLFNFLLEFSLVCLIRGLWASFLLILFGCERRNWKERIWWNLEEILISKCFILCCELVLILIFREIWKFWRRGGERGRKGMYFLIQDLIFFFTFQSSICGKLGLKTRRKRNIWIYLVSDSIILLWDDNS